MNKEIRKLPEDNPRHETHGVVAVQFDAEELVAAAMSVMTYTQGDPVAGRMLAQIVVATLTSLADLMGAEISDLPKSDENITEIGKRVAAAIKELEDQFLAKLAQEAAVAASEQDDADEAAGVVNHVKATTLDAWNPKGKAN